MGLYGPFTGNIPKEVSRISLSGFALLHVWDLEQESLRLRGNTMDPRQNVLAAMRRREPQWVPFIISLTPPMQELFEDKTGSSDPAEYFNFDLRSTGFRSPESSSDFRFYYPDGYPEGSYLDEWGILNVPGSMYHFTKMVNPLRNANHLDEIRSYPMPDYFNPSCYLNIQNDTAQYQADGYAVLGSLEMTIFEVSWYLRGMENLFHDMLFRPDLAATLMDRITQIRIFQAATLARCGVDILALGDDIAIQTGMLMSPKMWRQWLKPRIKQVIDAAKAIKPDILIWYHTDGDCRQVIAELIEVGVDILNPVQPECLDPINLKGMYGDRLSFAGTIGTQTTMPFGKPADVRGVVEHMINTVGRGGGLLLAPTHVLEPDVPWENVLAFVEAAKELGRY